MDEDVKRADVQRHLQQIIDGLTEGVMIVHPDQRIAWANDTALALHGVLDLAGLGRTVAEYRQRFELRTLAGERLRADEYPVSRLLAGEAVAGLVVEVVPKDGAKPWVHDIRTLVLTGEEGGTPDWLVVIMRDETERFSAEARFEHAFAANPAPAVIARLADGRYVRLNEGFSELSGWTRETLVGRSMHEIDVLGGARERGLAVARLHEGRMIPQMEGMLPTADGRERAVLLSGQPISVGDAACMLFTFADLEGRKKAEHALRHSEERFSRLFHLAPAPMTILTAGDLVMLDVNDAFTSTTGWRREEVLGKREDELLLWEAGESRRHFERRLRDSGQAHSIEIGLRRKGGAAMDFLLSAETVTIHDRDCLLCVMQDITERKRTEADLREAIAAVLREDTSHLGQRIVERLTNLSGGGTGGAGPELASLPERARTVLGLMAAGCADEEIARRLGISRNTVRNHIAAIYDRIGLRRRSAVIVWARERGLGLDGKSQSKAAKSPAGRTRSRKQPSD